MRSEAPNCILRKRFSLVELMIVLVLIGLILAVAIPRVGFVPVRVQKKRVHDSLVQASSMARHFAIAYGSVTEVKSDKGGMTIEPLPNESWAEFGHYSLPEGCSLASVEEGSVLFRFHPSGDAESAQDLAVVGDEFWLVVEVDPLTGAVELKEEE